MNISQNFLKRLPTYYRVIKQFKDDGIEYVAASDISMVTNFNVELVKKDLQIVSSEVGKPNKGRNTSILLNDFSDFLGYTKLSDAILVGAGHLGTALLNYDGFNNLGLNIIAGFDVNPEKIGKVINGKPIYHVDELESFLKQHKTSIAILSTGNEMALQIAKDLYCYGVKAILNFTNANLDFNDDLIVENVNIAISLANLSHKLKMKKNKGND